MIKTMSKTRYADYRGVTRQAVGYWYARGYLVLLNGKIDVAASDKLLNGRPETYRGGRASKQVGGDA